MNSHVIELARYRLEKAKQARKDAELLLKNGSYVSAVNRIYYSMFYAARALLATRQLDSSKHSGVISMFHREFVKPGLMSKESGKSLGDAFQFRIEGDYEDYSEASHELAELLFTRGELFLAEAEKVLNQITKRKNH